MWRAPLYLGIRETSFESSLEGIKMIDNNQKQDTTSYAFSILLLQYYNNNIFAFSPILS